MKIEKQKNTQGFVLKTLAVSMLLVQTHAFALQALDDTDLRNVNGQDGIHLETTLDQANIKTLYWTDQTGRAEADATDQSLTATADNVVLKKSNAVTDPLKADIKLNMGTQNGKAGINLDVALSPMLMTVDSFRICDSDPSGNRCSAKIGDLAIQTTSNTVIGLKTQNGIFSKTDQAELNLGIQNANIYLGQTMANGTTGTLNQLILKNFNFNFLGKGFIFVDPIQGLKLQTNQEGSGKASLTQTPTNTYGYVDLTRVKDSASDKAGFINSGASYLDASGKATNAGLNLEIMLNRDVAKGSPYNLDATNTPVGAKGLIRVGASGRMVNGSLQFRGVQNANNLIGSAVDSTGNNTSKDIVGGSGLAFRMTTEFTKDNDSMLAGGGQATALEIGGAGLNTYGFEFGNLTGLQKDTRASFDTGSVFLNLTDSKQLTLPKNLTFQASRFGNGSTLTTDGSVVNGKQTVNDYAQDIYTTMPDGNRPYSLVASIRGGEFQAISRRGRFTNSAGMTDPKYLINNYTDNQWGLALPFYNLNANMAVFGTTVDAKNSFFYYLVKDGDQYRALKNFVALSGTTPRLGFSLGMTTDGRNADGSKTTSIMVIDGSKDYYMGLRNVDMLLKGNGSIGVENGSLNLSLKNMVVVMAAELAAGYLPGAKYASCGNTPIDACKNQSVAPLNNFSIKDDVLMGLKLRFGGDMDLSLIPNSQITADGTGGQLGVAGELTLTGTNNTIQISDPINGSTLGLDNLTGKIGFNNAIVIGKNASSGDGQVGFNASLNFNPDQTTNGVFRARDLNFYPPQTGPGARLGEIAITGGRLNSQLNIIPRNTSN